MLIKKYTDVKHIIYFMALHRTAKHPCLDFIGYLSYPRIIFIQLSSKSVKDGLIVNVSDLRLKNA